MSRGILQEAEAEHIVRLPKRVKGPNNWQQRDDGNWYMEMPVEAPEQWPLRLYGRFNPRTGCYTFILFCGTLNVRRLDVGKRHHNPDCNDVGPVHKHTWTDRSGDKWAYEPSDISSANSIRETFFAFLAECHIAFEGQFREPPQTYQKGLL